MTLRYTWWLSLLFVPLFLTTSAAQEVQPVQAKPLKIEPGQIEGAGPAIGSPATTATLQTKIAQQAAIIEELEARLHKLESVLAVDEERVTLSAPGELIIASAGPTTIESSAALRLEGISVSVRAPTNLDIRSTTAKIHADASAQLDGAPLALSGSLVRLDGKPVIINGGQHPVARVNSAIAGGMGGVVAEGSPDVFVP